MYPLHLHSLYYWFSTINKHNRIPDYLKRKTHAPAHCYSLQCKCVINNAILWQKQHISPVTLHARKCSSYYQKLCIENKEQKCLNTPKLKYFVQVNISTPKVSTATFNTSIFSGKWNNKFRSSLQACNFISEKRTSYIHSRSYSQHKPFPNLYFQ